MSDGKRSTAERILYKSFDIIKEKTSDDPLKVFKKAIDNVKPSLEVKSRRVGGSNYQVPVEVNPEPAPLMLSIRWIVGYATSRGDGKTMQEKLANELLDAANLRGRRGQESAKTPHRMAGSQQGLRPLSLVLCWPAVSSAVVLNADSQEPRAHIRMARPESTPRKNPQYRHHGPHRCR